MKHILVVDDDLDLSSVIKAVLEHAGYSVSLAQQVRRGIELAKELKPDLILMDIILPEMNGAEAVKVLKEQPGLEDTPVIFLTGIIAENDHIDVLPVEGHAYQVLTKPFENSRLLELMACALR